MPCPYLEGTNFTPQIDRHVVKWIHSLADAIDKLARLPFRLMKYNFDIIHWACIKQQAAAASLRLETEGADDSNIDDDIQIRAITTQAQKRHSEITGCVLVQTHSERYEPHLLNIIKIMRAQGTDAYC